VQNLTQEPFDAFAASDLAAINIGRLSPAFPVTPPYVRVRIRRFGCLNDRPHEQTGYPERVEVGIG